MTTQVRDLNFNDQVSSWNWRLIRTAQLELKEQVPSRWIMIEFWILLCQEQFQVHTLLLPVLYLPQHWP